MSLYLHLREKNKPSDILLTSKMLHEAFLATLNRRAARLQSASAAASANREWTDPDLKGIAHAHRQA